MNDDIHIEDIFPLEDMLAAPVDGVVDYGECYQQPTHDKWRETYITGTLRALRIKRGDATIEIACDLWRKHTGMVSFTRISCPYRVSLLIDYEHIMLRLSMYVDMKDAPKPCPSWLQETKRRLADLTIFGANGDVALNASVQKDDYGCAYDLLTTRNVNVDPRGMHLTNKGSFFGSDDLVEMLSRAHVDFINRDHMRIAMLVEKLGWG